MRALTVKYDVRRFTELSPAAKKKAIHHFLHDPHRVETDDFQFVLDDWEEKLNAQGLRDVNIEYRVGGSQGDGACFRADVNADVWWRVNHPQRPCDYSGVLVQFHLRNHHYTHENTYEIDVEPDVSEFEALFKAWYKRTCREIHSNLEEHNSWLYSDEYADDTLTESDLWFFMDGTLFEEPRHGEIVADVRDPGQTD